VDQYKPTGVRQQLRAALSGVSGEITQMRQRKEKLEREIRNFTQAIADGGHSKYILEEIAMREKEISTTTDRLFSATSDSVEGHLSKVGHLVEEAVADLRG
jgi:alkylhydroperoxidase/carboxymuconolactone decarboxylase family protein YurZ